MNKPLGLAKGFASDTIARFRKVKDNSKKIEGYLVQDEQKRSHQTPPNDRKQVDPTLSTPEDF